MSDNVANSVGEMLRSAREAKQLTLDAANRDTKISVDILSALEQDDFDAVGSYIYLMGFLRDYARFLGVDVDSVLRACGTSRKR
jgi:cytoskeletal protein RodZ